MWGISWFNRCITVVVPSYSSFQVSWIVQFFVLGLLVLPLRQDLRAFIADFLTLRRYISAALIVNKRPDPRHDPPHRPIGSPRVPSRILTIIHLSFVSIYKRTGLLEVTIMIAGSTHGHWQHMPEEIYMVKCEWASIDAIAACNLPAGHYNEYHTRQFILYSSAMSCPWYCRAQVDLLVYWTGSNQQVSTRNSCTIDCAAAGDARWAIPCWEIAGCPYFHPSR